MKNKTFTYILGILLLLPFHTSQALALSLQDFRKEIFRPSNLPGGETGNVSPETKVIDVLNFLIELILYASGSVAVVMLIYGGIRFITSVGEPEEKESAVKIIKQVIFGLLIVIVAFALVTNVIDLIFSATT